MATLGRIQHHYPALEGLDATAAKVYAPGGSCGMHSTSTGDGAICKAGDQPGDQVGRRNRGPGT